ncbi:MAG: hypothetical protein M0P91_09670 [Sulfuricurvum sp.]|jgi:hypothetical protein|uniref:hypothetical protein n=1 Tax=Sulfuricurvum sp. TaxID=2025608 RepID=UPI0025EAECF6|nr:hypothetical protein [Sulfuricurvum sp.]MCK9373456.1 hypothetical protein [Sulfuricurvum sp.]
MLIKQSVKGKFATIDAVINLAALATLETLMEGVISTFTEKSSGGVDIATAPATMRGMKFGVGRKADKLSCTVSFKHIKPTKHSTDVFTHMALFDADWKSALPATHINQIYQGAK